MCIPTQHLEDPTTTTTTVAPVYICRSGWKIFYRDSYNWCMKAIYGDTLVTDALKDCQSLNSKARPTGFQTMAEVTELCAFIQAQQDYAYTSLMIGANRTKSCFYSDLTAKCTNLTTFYWTDGYTTGSAGFNWGPGSPQYLRDTGGTQPNDFVWIDTGSTLMYDEWYETDSSGGVLCGMLADVVK